MKIDKSTGTISFAQGAIGPSLDKAGFLDSHIGRASRKTLANADWSHYEIDPEERWSGTVIFDGERIDRVFLSMKLGSSDPADWTVEREKDKQANHDSWLEEELGPAPYRYTWGRVVSDFDPKGLASEIIVVYGR